MVGQTLKLVGLVLSLGLDTFAVSVALGVSGLSPSDRKRAAISFALFEGLMPLVGVVIGGMVSKTIGPVAALTGIAILLAVGGWMIYEARGEEAEGRGPIAGWRGLVLASLSVSMDELAVGFSLGLLGVNIPLAVILITAQAFLVTTVGVRLGARAGRKLAGASGPAAGLLLIGLACFLFIQVVR